MATDGPMFTVFIPASSRVVTGALSSIEAQTFRDFEVVIVDDGSTDGRPLWLLENDRQFPLMSSRTTRASMLPTTRVERPGRLFSIWTRTIVDADTLERIRH